MELYNNTADCSRTDGCYYWATIRGGQAIVTNNTITETGQTWSSTPVMITYYRLGHGMAVDYCVSTDWNVVRCTSYPCEDQPGYVGTTQYPQYIWGNTFTPKFGNPFYKVQTWSGINDGQNCAIAPTAINASGQCNAGSAIGACFVAINRDYYLSAKPGYTPYAYPHPLAVGTPPPDTTPPEPPSGVVII